MTHAERAQKVSCAAALAKPPGASTPTSSVALSELRFTWYSEPAKFPNSARTVLCAATHGVPAASKMSHGPPVTADVAPAAAARRAVRILATTISHAC
jgi:hypothetical protein